jgi:hypothetical protein
MMFLLFLVYVVVTLYMAYDRFSESYGDPVDEREKKQ